jgi:hypothetical protein
MPSRAGRWPTALFLAALTATGACTADEQPITGPVVRANEPGLAVGDIITVTNAKGGTESGSLRWAVAQTTGGEVIQFDAKLAGTTIILDSTLVISNAVTIQGPVDKGITISGGGKGRVIDIAVMDIAQPATKLRNLSVTGGKLTTEGGAGIRASSPVEIEHATVWGNEAGGAPAILTIVYGALTLVNSTVSGNISTGYLYPAIIAGSYTKVHHSTIAYNSQGGISFWPYANAVLSNSIVAHNGTLQNNCMNIDVVWITGTNISNDMSCGDSTVVTIADPQLLTLRDNGGPSMTHALASFSPAFNRTGFCGLAVDQRYQPRDAQCDVGAFESTEPTTVSLVIDRVGSMFGAGAQVTGTVTCSRAGDQFTLQVDLRQRGSDKTIMQGVTGITVTCTTAAQPWSVVVTPSAGAFSGGSATATATTTQVPSWFTPASASRTVRILAP